MKSAHFILAALALVGACKKHDNTNPYDSNVKPYFKDIIIQEKLLNGNLVSWQHALGYFPSKDDPNTQIMVASLGVEELNDARGFRIASINKTTGKTNWVKSYDLDDQYLIQIATCATMDNDGFVWVGGHSFVGTQSARLFLLKMDGSGNIVWSNSFSNYSRWRAYSLTTLRNGDLAFLTKGPGGLMVHRITANGLPVWSTIVGYTNTYIDDDYYTTPPNVNSPENHALVETADGSIYFATSSNSSGNGVGGSDRLYRLDANGKLQFAQIYTLDGNSAPVRPVQLINAGNDRLLMADQVFRNITGPSPYFVMLSLNGDVRLSRGRPANGDGFWGSCLNEINWYQDNLYFSTNGNREFDTYVIDNNLQLKSAVKTAAAQDIGTDRGGISLFDAADRALYYVLNFGGNWQESNGFEVTRNDATGKPCINTYVNPPSSLQLQDLHVTVVADKVDTTGYGPAPTFTPLTWRPNPVAVIATENVCGQ